MPHIKFNNIVIAIVVVLLFSACGSSDLENRKEKIQSMENSTSAEALNRKERNEKILLSEGVPVNKYLPVIETESEVTKRTKEAVAYRALALLVVAVKGEGLEQPVVEKIVKDYGLDSHFTPDEKAFIKSVAPTEHERIQFAWRYEAAWTLLWSLGYVKELDKPVSICNVEQAVTFMQERTVEEFIKDAKLQPTSAILDQADLIYRYDWAVVDARVNNKVTPGKLESGVVKERHYALNWLIGYMNQEWDDISTDT